MFAAAADLGEIAAGYVALGLLLALAFLLEKLISAMHFSIGVGPFSVQPLGWLAGLLKSYLLDGVNVCIAHVQGAVASLQNGLVTVWRDEVTGATAFARLVKGAFLYLWGTALKPFVHSLEATFETDAKKAKAAVAALGTTVATNFNLAKTWASDHATAALNEAKAFTRGEVSAARTDAAAASAQLTARLDGIGTQAEALAGEIAASPGLIWSDLKSHLDVRNLADATLLGMLGALGIHSLTQATGLDNAECQGKIKQVCQSDAAQWAKLLEGLALIGFGFNFRELVAFAETLAADAAKLVSDAK